MTTTIRGQEANLTLAVDNRVQTGSFFKVTNFTTTAKIEDTDRQYIGQNSAEPDQQFDGHQISFSVDMQDRIPLELLASIVGRLERGEPPANVQITVQYLYRDVARSSASQVYYDVVLSPQDTGAGGRKEAIATNYVGNCRRMRLI